MKRHRKKGKRGTRIKDKKRMLRSTRDWARFDLGLIGGAGRFGLGLCYCMDVHTKARLVKEKEIKDWGGICRRYMTSEIVAIFALFGVR